MQRVPVDFSCRSRAAAVVSLSWTNCCLDYDKHLSKFAVHNAVRKAAPCVFCQTLVSGAVRSERELQ